METVAWRGRVVDFFHPCLELLVASAPDRPPMRIHAGSALAFDDATSTLLILEPGGAGDPPLIHRVTPEGAPRGTRPVPDPGADPAGLAVDPTQGDLVVSYRAGRLTWVSRTGVTLAVLDLHARGLGAPGPFAFDATGERLTVLDPDARRIVHLTRAGDVLRTVPLDACEAVPSGIALAPGGKHLLVASRAELPSARGLITEVTPGGQAIRAMETAPLGFAPLDLTSGPDGRLFVLSRPYVLPHTYGDHGHVFVIDPSPGGEEPSPNPTIVRRLLRANNLFAPPFRGRAQGQSSRWPSTTVQVGVDPTVDGELVERALAAWSAATGGLLRFALRRRPPATGIRVAGGRVPHATGGPRPAGRVTVVAGNSGWLPSHPAGTPPATVRLRVLQHELGHALGFRGHSPRFGLDVMNGICGHSLGISPEEGRFMTLLYAFPPRAPASALLDATGA